MEKKKLGLILGLVICCLFTLPVLAKSQHNLNLNLQEGHSYNLKIKAVQQIKQDFFGNQMTIKQNFISKNKYYVKEIDAQNNYILVVEYDDLQLQLQELGGDFGGVKEQEFKTKFNRSMRQAAQSVQGEKFTMKISPQGKLLKLEGYQEILTQWQQAVKKYQRQNNVTTGAGIENFFDEKFMKQLWKNILAYIPQRPVRVGEDWESKFELTAPLSTTIVNNYKLQQVKKGEKIIATHAPIDIKNLTLPQQRGQGIAYNLKGQQKGQLILETNSNWIQQGTLDFKADGTMEVENSMIEGKLKMPVSSFINIKLSRY